MNLDKIKNNILQGDFSCDDYEKIILFCQELRKKNNERELYDKLTEIIREFDYDVVICDISKKDNKNIDEYVKEIKNFINNLQIKYVKCELGVHCDGYIYDKYIVDFEYLDNTIKTHYEFKHNYQKQESDSYSEIIFNDASTNFAKLVKILKMKYVTSGILSNIFNEFYSIFPSADYDFSWNKYD